MLLGDAHRPLVGHRRLVLLAQLAVALEPAGGEQHAALGEQPHGFTVAHGLDADDPAVLDDQPLECGVRADLAVAGVRERQQGTPDQCLPADHGLGCLDTPPFGPQRAPHERFEIAEFGAVDVRREDRAALAQRAGSVGEVVGNAAPLELADRRIGFQLLDHPRAGFEIGLPQRDRGVVADDGVEIRAGGSGAAFEPGPHFGRVAGEPDAGAGPRGRAADEVRLLDHQRPQTARRRRIGAEQPAAGAHDDHVVPVTFLAHASLCDPLLTGRPTHGRANTSRASSPAPAMSR